MIHCSSKPDINSCDTTFGYGDTTSRKETSHHWDNEVSIDDDEDRRNTRLRLTMHFTENTEQADTTHDQNDTTTFIL